MSERVAVVGVGQTKYAAKRQDVSIAGLVREAAMRALEDAGMTWSDIDAVVIGKAPDMFEGVMMPELYLADALGAVGKPMMRVHTAGSVGGSTGVMASHLVSAGAHKRVLVVCFEKQSESNATWALSIRLPFAPGLVAGAGGYFAPIIRAYMRRSGAPDHIGIKVAVKDRLNALKNPYAHLQIPDISEEMVRESPMLWDPIRYLETCPSSDGAVRGRARGREDRRGHAQPAGLAARHGGALGADDRRRPRHREPARRQGLRRGRLRAGRHHRPAPRDRLRRDLRAVLLVRADVAGEPRLRRGGQGLEAGRRRRPPRSTGDLPINMSGGVLSSNPIGASGMCRFAEAALQVRGMAGEHQVDGARLALGQAYGGGSQFFAMWVVGSDKP